MRAALAALALTVLPAAAPAEDALRSVPLVPHRAVYDLSLLRSTGSRGVESARGRIAFDFAGDVCDGYTLNYRQVTVLEGGETGTRTLDVRTATYESGDGRLLRFKTESQLEGTPDDGVDGEARLAADGSLSVQLKQPQPAAIAAEAGPIFPTEHLKRVIEAARAGQTTMSVKLYDGSDDGRKVYDTLTVIGHRIDAGAADKLEQPARNGALASLPRWPVTISYFTSGRGEQTPVYTISFELYENGVSRALKLDYGEFAIKGELHEFELLPATACQR
jgi:hypothetical protein